MKEMKEGKEIENGWKEIGMEGWIQCKSCQLHILLEDAECMGCPRCHQIYLKSNSKSKENHSFSSNHSNSLPQLSSLTLFHLFSQNSGPDPAPILNFLYLGSMIGVGKRERLKELENEFRKDNSISKEGNIIHILNVAEEVKNQFPGDYDYKNYLLEDVEDENILKHLEETSNWIAQMKSMNEIVIVHCAAGVSRSATVVLAYLMKNEHMSLKDAYSFLKKKRNVISPNSGFLTQLMEYEKQIFGKSSVLSITELDPRALLISCSKKKD